MRVLIFESSLSGHRASYVRNLAISLNDDGADVVIAVPEQSLSSQEFCQSLEVAQCRVCIEPYDRPEVQSAFGRAARDMRAFDRIVDKLNPDYAYLTTGEAIARALAVNRFRLNRRSCQTEALLMRSGYGYGSPGVLGNARRLASDLLLRVSPLEVIHTLDPFSFVSLQKLGIRNAALMPESIQANCTMEQMDARDFLGLPTDKRVVVCPGTVSTRKGADLLLKAASACNTSEICLALYGKTSQSIRELIESEFQTEIGSKKVIVLDRYLSDRELEASFVASDIVATVYPGHTGSSSILLKAARYGRPVIASDDGWPGWATRTFGLGATVDPSRSSALTDYFRSPSLVKVDAEKEELRRQFLDYHTPENQMAHWLKRFRIAHGVKRLEPKLFPFIIGGEVTTDTKLARRSAA